MASSDFHLQFQGKLLLLNNPDVKSFYSKQDNQIFSDFDDATTVTIDPVKSRKQRKAETGFLEDETDTLNEDDKTEVNESH